MDTLRLDEFKRLSAPQAGHCISLYLPTHVGGVAGEDDGPRLARLVERAEELLVKGGLRSPDARELMEPVRRLPADREFWKRRNRSLAVFVGTGIFQAIRIPLEIAEEVTVGRRFRLKPLLPMLSGNDAFYILTLSQHHARLYSATKYTAEEVPVPGLDQSLSEALGVETADRGEQVHAAASLGAGKGISRKQAGVFHGQGSHRETVKDDIVRYFRLVDEKLHDTLRDQQRPLVLAAVEYLLPLYRDVCTYPHVLAEGVSGNFDLASPAELRERAWPIVEPHLLAARRKAEERYRELGGAKRFAVSELKSVLVAAQGGRVAALFVDPRHEVQGEFDEVTGELFTHPAGKANDDLVELAIAQTVSKGGVVYPLDADNEKFVDGPLCALLRY